MGRRKKDVITSLEEVRKLEASKPDILDLKTLDAQLHAVNANVSDMLIHGGSPDLIELSWKLYEQYKTGDFKDVIKDEDELKLYCDFKKKELVMRFIAFLDLASKSILSQSKLDLASIKEIAGAMTSVSSLVNSFLGEADKIIKHDHILEIRQIEDPIELNRRIQENQKKLQALEIKYDVVIEDEFLKDPDPVF